MKGVNIDDFVWVFIAGIIALLLAFLVGYFAYQPPVPQLISIENISVGTAGYTNEYEAKVYNIGDFTAGKTQTESLKYVPELRVSASLTGKETKTYTINVPDYYLSVLKSLRISFLVSDTNKYGNLVIKWNGKDVYNGRADKGEHVISIEAGYVKSLNTFEMYCESPGSLFWASTVYMIKDLRIDLEYGEVKIVPFKISEEEIERFTRGNIHFKTNEGEGRLAIKINGLPVYNKHPSAYESIDFDLFNSSLYVGNNVLSFSTSKESVYITDAVLRVYLTNGNVILKKSFSISEENFKLLNQTDYKGKIEYYVKKTIKPGTLVIKLNGKDLKAISSEGWHTLYFDAEDILPGDNELSFSGSGSWNIPEARIWIVKE